MLIVAMRCRFVRPGPELQMIDADTSPMPARDSVRAMLRGLKGRCPSCGQGALFSSYLKVNDQCPQCGEELHHQRADDAPPYFTIVIVGHIIVGGVLAVEKAFAPASWVHAVLWLPLTLASSLWLLPRVKGALIALQWALYMHGFEDAWRRSEAKALERAA